MTNSKNKKKTLEQYKTDLKERLKFAGNAFYEVNNFYSSPLNKNREIKKELLTKAVEVMPTFGEAIAVIDSIPPKELGNLVKKNIVHDSVVLEVGGTEAYGIGRPDYRLQDAWKTYFLLYLQGKISVEDDKSMLHLMGKYEFENLGRICLSAQKVCENIDGIESRL